MPFEIDICLIKIDTCRDDFNAVRRREERLVLEETHFSDIKSGYNRSTYIGRVFFFRRAMENKNDDY